MVILKRWKLAFATPSIHGLKSVIGGRQPFARANKSSLFGVRPAPTPNISAALGTKTSSLFLKPGQLSTRPQVFPQQSSVSDIVSKVQEGILKSRKVNTGSTYWHVLAC